MHLYVFVVLFMVYVAHGALLLFLLPRLLINFNFRPKFFTSCHLSLGFGQLQHPLQSISSVSFLPDLFVLPNLSLILFLFPFEHNFSGYLNNFLLVLFCVCVCVCVKLWHPDTTQLNPKYDLRPIFVCILAIFIVFSFCFEYI